MRPQGPMIEKEYGNNMGTNVLQALYKTSICFHSHFVFSLKPLCGFEKSTAGPLNSSEHCLVSMMHVHVGCCFGPWQYELREAQWISKMPLDTKNSFSLNLFQRMGLIWFVCLKSPEHENTQSVRERVTNSVVGVRVFMYMHMNVICVSVHARRLCVWHFAYCLLVYTATWKFHWAGWDCLLFALKTWPKLCWRSLYFCGFFYWTWSRLYLFDQWMWTVEVPFSY